jgi:hypothetical protein
MADPSQGHPDYPQAQDIVSPCPVCQEVPDFSKMPRGSYQYVLLADGRAACQLLQPLDPLVIPYLSGPVIAHVCAHRPAKAVIAEAEAIAKGAVGG